MSLGNSIWPAAKTGSKTNSLGSAKVDCHTCLQFQSRCDRQRPRCGTCIKNHRDCGGFTMDLVWNHSKGSAGSRQSHSKASKHVNAGDKESRTKEPNERQFRFVQGRRRMKRTPQLRSGERRHPTVNDDGHFSIITDEYSHLNTNSSGSNDVSVFGDILTLESPNSEMKSHEDEAGKFKTQLFFELSLVITKRHIYRCFLLI